MQSEEMMLRRYLTAHPRQAAAALTQLAGGEVVTFLETEPTELAVAAISGMPGQDAVSYLQQLNPERARQIVAGLDLNQQRDILRLSEERFGQQLLDGMPPDRAASLRRFLAAGKDTVGFVMYVPAFRPEGELSVAQAVRMIRAEGRGSPARVVVVNPAGEPVGILRVRDLLFAEETAPISSLMERQFPTFYVDEPISSVAAHPDWDSYPLIPVIDRDRRMVGSVSLKTLGQVGTAATGPGRDLVETGSALGELYRIGLTGFIQSLG
jgi:magnesium transporter